MNIKPITAQYAVSEQLSPDDFSALRDAGYTTVICNRPDAEIPPYLHASEMAKAAEEAGVVFHALPLTHQTMTAENVSKQFQLVDAADGELVVALNREGDPGGRVDRDRVRVAERELDRGALRLHAVSGADHLETLGVSLGHADDLVLDERAREAVERARVALVVRSGHDDLVVVEGDPDGLRDREAELALGALDGDGLAVDLHLDTTGDVDGHASDS